MKPLLYLFGSWSLAVGSAFACDRADKLSALAMLLGLMTGALFVGGIIVAAAIARPK